MLNTNLMYSQCAIMKSNDEKLMARALQLASKGERWVSPNPMVGAVLAKKGVIIAEGWHELFGGRHAEINALERAGGKAAGSTLYVNLEPCSHFGKTPPCVKRVIEAGISRVVIGSRDPNPLVAGKGIRALKAHGIETAVGILKKESVKLNEKFFKFMETGTPFITMKIAQTIDGRIATLTGDSQWISSPASRRFAHRERSLHDGILVGIGTVLKDDPSLTVRLVKGKNPVRIVVDSSLKIPLGSAILKDQDTARTIIAVTSRHDRKKASTLQEMRIGIIEAGENKVDLKALLKGLAKMNISSVLLEGGAGVFTSFLDKGLIDRALFIIAPLVTGKGTDAFGDLGIRKIGDSLRFEVRKVLHRGTDIILDCRPAGR